MPPTNGIYLPGWEFNRVLAASPLEPRISALPGAVLWNGAAQFWMFEKVYCTKESFDNEAYSAQELGWATGSIFTQLATGIGGSGPILEPVDWTTLAPGPKQALDTVWKRLKDVQPVRQWIDQANDPALQQLNSTILGPVAEAKSSIVAGSMSGLRHWVSPADPGTAPASASRNERVEKLLADLSAPVTNRQARNGIHVLKHPRAWDPAALARQDQAKERVETPYIRDLQAGEGEFAGPQGYEPYIQRVGTERAAYKDINDALLADWQNNYTRLLRVRDVASKYLWPKLHSEWLPALLKDEPDAVKDFPHWISRALKERHLAQFFNLSTKQVYGLSVGALGLAGAKHLSPVELVELAAVGSAGFAVIWDRRIAPNSGPLAVFYQQAFRTLRDG